MGEISTDCYVDIAGIARKVINDIGYDNQACGFNGNTCAVLTSIDQQSPDIAMGVNESYELKDGENDANNQIGAGDQGMMFGYACDETKELMPLAISLSHKLCMKLTDVRKEKVLQYLRPDGKAQVTVEYEDGKPVRLESVVVSCQHGAEKNLKKLDAEIREKVLRSALRLLPPDEDTKILINPSGKFVCGGFDADTGLTGRKLMVDTYGSMVPHGGGAFSGKDCTKVDRSAAYAARYVAKNIVAAGLADRCEIQLSYAIGVARPTSIMVDTFGTGKLDEEKIVEIIRENFDLRPNGIIKMLDLRRPIYKQTAAYGHFGRTDLNLPWEKLDKVDALAKYLG